MCVKVERYFEMDKDLTKLFAEVVHDMQCKAEEKDHLLMLPPTQTEMEVAYHYVVDGWSRTEVADFDFRSIKTVDVHMTHFRSKCRMVRIGWYDITAQFWYKAGQLNLSPPD